MKTTYKALKPYLLLWSTQSVSALGSSLTNFALVIWLYQKSGSALQTALLSVCSYAPYVLMSIFAGALSDRWDKRRTMLGCDLMAAMCTVIVLVLLKKDMLMPWHMYLLNAINGLMNTLQQPASDVASTLLVPQKYYQKACALRSLSQSVNTILTPVIASAIYACAGIYAVIAVDLVSFAVAFVALLLFIALPAVPRSGDVPEGLMDSVRMGLRWLRENPLILSLILFLAFINLIASAFNAALPAYILPNPRGGETVLGLVNMFAGVATLAGSLIMTLLPAPRNRIKVICIALFISMGTENFMLALGRAPWIWCVGSIVGWLSIPVMNANLDVAFRSSIPAHMQGRVYSCRNTLQFFTIPVGYFLGGLLIDNCCEPFMAQSQSSLLHSLLGSGKGSGAGLMLMCLGVIGVMICVVFSVILRKYRWSDQGKAHIR